MLQTLPLYLWVSIVIFIIIPAILTLGLRIKLHNHLVNLKKNTNDLYATIRMEKETPFNKHLREKFERLNNKLENVNTIALIDGLFYEQTFIFLGKKVRCDQAEYITKVLPNLLLGFGLLGTFIGITLNLGSIYDVIGGNSGQDINNLLDQLQIPLESMSIAFVSSLSALFFSSLLIVVNIFWNVSLEKRALINNLENYFDNHHQLSQQGETRLDKAVNRMVKQQEDFLLRFHENVGQVLERTFKQATDQLIEQNKRSHELSVDVYQNLLGSSSTLNNGANIFKESTDKMDTLLQKFTDSINALELSATKIQDSAIKIENSKFADNLGDLTHSLLNVQEKFNQSTINIADNVQEFVFQNKLTQNLNENIYLELGILVEQLGKTLTGFTNLTDGIKDENLSIILREITDTLVSSKEQFIELNQLLETKINLIDNTINKLPESLSDISSLNDNLAQFLQLDQKITQEIRKLESYLDSWQVKNKEILNHYPSSSNNEISSSNLENIQEINYKLALFTEILRDIREELKTFNTLEEKSISFRLLAPKVKFRS
ncbi:hypothetical protein Cyast_1489 [Cyanobacterium stanieri PCC 7202]|uniref:MotA/TolQ/ExbB proton channel domain-containing protein n=1 Tax=Cyanobacterium stanieri (strain ATCC 29140 / PCC 7202) TaxID=292563 RepID=K9YLU5_CYASC|nr:hypothetical protein Cyast_1489 [Cyanobacterium stanieri PCC 7202]